LTDEETSYRGRKIIVRTDGKNTLLIDNSEVVTRFDEEARRYFSPSLPYRTFPSLVDLAKAIIDQS
jgi:hypothetical protein